ncbi:hypothetical protein BB558_000706 [Smittium angustum]|uniref:Pre-mRNA-splicing factor SLT11 n=1 Tax=Smittium angustum TaxID=133377 RepID=A0A2U1JDM6_SMIAN|nr:hypothetical protein BB558_000706 [Smittium angustum]
MSKAENKETWEDSDFPILCGTCLGENPYVRMTKQKYGNECKICQRPFTVFRWLPGPNMRYKKTEICQVCAKAKNVCQTCILDLKYGLPVQVRDTALGIEDSAPRSDVNRQFYNQSLENKIESGLIESDFSGSTNSAGREQLMRVARSMPYYKRNLPHICSFFVKGECTRGNECPYRHELPEPDTVLAKQNIADRYHGKNDPVAMKILDRANKNSDFKPPEDRSITSLFVSNLHESITEEDLKEYFSAFGELKSVAFKDTLKCAFINFSTRASAEAAADRSFGGCTIKGHLVRMAWGRPRPKGPQTNTSSLDAVSSNNPNMAAKLASKGIKSKSLVNEHGIVLPPGITSDVVKYPSQDPTLQGSTTAKN